MILIKIFLLVSLSVVAVVAVSSWLAMRKKDIPPKNKVLAIAQWSKVSLGLFWAVLAGVAMAFIAALTARKTTNFLGEESQEHSEKYLAQGSSGHWEYWASPIPFVRLWSNYEDGDLGEPSGKQSVRCGGKERTFWNRYKWLAFRNPFNLGKRTIPAFHCMVDDCDIQYFGQEVVSDKSEDKTGWNFTIATHRVTGKKYYGFYSVKYLGDNKVRVWRIGFKIKPTHAGEVQDIDDKDKAFTFRYQHSSEIN
jgi:hypothetical protein